MSLATNLKGIIPRMRNKVINALGVSFMGRDENKLKIPVFPEWFFSARLGQPRNANLLELRTFARSPWVQTILNTIRKEVRQIPYEMVLADEKSDDDIANHEEDIKKIDDYFKKINSNNETIYDLMDPVITDLGVLDAGVWTFVYSADSYVIENVDIPDEAGNFTGDTQPRLVLKPFGQRQLLENWYADGATFLYDIDIFRKIRGYYQYTFKNPRSTPLFFQKEELYYFVMNRQSFTLYGFSPVQSAQQEIELMMQSTRYNKDFFEKNMIPDGLVMLEDADEDTLKRAQGQWEEKIQGKPHKLMFLNSKGKLELMNRTNREMEWLEGQKWYYHIVFAQFGLSPAEVGFHEDVNRSTQEGQERVTVKNAIRPYLDRFEEAINNRIIPEFLKQEKPAIKFKFKPRDHAIEKIEFEQDMKEVENGSLTINEFRKKRGRDDVEWGDQPIKKQSFSMDSTGFGNPNDPSTQSSTQSGTQSGTEKEKDKGQPKKPNKKDFKTSNGVDTWNSNIQKDIVNEGDDLIEQSKDYDEFIQKNMERWESKALSSIDELDFSKSIAYNKKTFGEFLAILFSGINTISFLKGVKKFVRKDMKKGLEDAEAQTNTDIGITPSFTNRIDALADQELNGYTINGKKWHGMKGVTNELRIKILKSIQEGAQQKETRKELKSRVKAIFTMAKDSQAERIARTESNRFFNEGKLKGFKESGIKANKTWQAVNDADTSDICKRLERKYGKKGIPFDEPFLDDETGKEFQNPPAHVNCRSIISLSLK